MGATGRFSNCHAFFSLNWIISFHYFYNRWRFTFTLPSAVWSKCQYSIDPEMRVVFTSIFPPHRVIGSGAVLQLIGTHCRTRQLDRLIHRSLISVLNLLTAEDSTTLSLTVCVCDYTPSCISVFTYLWDNKWFMVKAGFVLTDIMCWAV